MNNSKTNNRPHNGELISEFKNQLTHKEIIKGILIYINKGLLKYFNRKLLIGIILLIVIVFAISISKNDNLFLVLSGLIGTAIVLELLLIFMTKLQFSINKIATYKLYDGCLEIINSNGVSYIFKYNHIRIIEAKDIIVLCLPQAGSFAIVAKRLMNAEQIKILTTNSQKRNGLQCKTADRRGSKNC